jgi:hypothetical protein
MTSSDVLQKLSLLKAIKDQIANQCREEQLTNKARVFKVTVLEPILGCLENHFDNNEERFMTKWRKLAHTQFRMKSCNGKGSDCKPEK